MSLYLEEPALSIKYLNKLLELPPNYPVSEAISKIKDLVNFKKEHLLCKF